MSTVFVLHVPSLLRMQLKHFAPCRRANQPRSAVIPFTSQASLSLALAAIRKISALHAVFAQTQIAVCLVIARPRHMDRLDKDHRRAPAAGRGWHLRSFTAMSLSMLGVCIFSLYLSASLYQLERIVKLLLEYLEVLRLSIK